ncbi:MAG: ParB/Srx family N-terminal domain-containing protein [Bryobacteraceae bacterium]
MNTDIRIERWPIARLIPRVNNPRTHSREQVANIAASIQEFGWTNPILIGADDDIIAGHARLLAAEKLAMKEVPVIVLRHLSPAQRRALVIADNQLAIGCGVGRGDVAHRTGDSARRGLRPQPGRLRRHRVTAAA